MAVMVINVFFTRTTRCPVNHLRKLTGPCLTSNNTERSKLQKQHFAEAPRLPVCVSDFGYSVSAFFLRAMAMVPTTTDALLGVIYLCSYFLKTGLFA